MLEKVFTFQSSFAIHLNSWKEQTNTTAKELINKIRQLAESIFQTLSKKLLFISESFKKTKLIDSIVKMNEARKISKTAKPLINNLTKREINWLLKIPENEREDCIQAMATINISIFSDNMIWAIENLPKGERKEIIELAMPLIDNNDSEIEKIEVIREVQNLPKSERKEICGAPRCLDS